MKDYNDLIVYQIYPRSYKDTTGNGIGDLRGIIENLKYVKDLGANAIWISPFFKSPMLDFGYDVSDHKDVDPLFGTLADYKDLVKKAHQMDIKIIIDLVLSHTSHLHEWFVESRSGRVNKKSDWYVWADPKDDGNPPNNWLSIFGGSAWQYDSRRKQYYLHNFLKEQPDLNFHNPDVVDAQLDLVEYWLDLGTDGFRFDTANFYYHHKSLKSNPPWSDSNAVAAGVTDMNPYSKQHHLYDKSQPENLDFFEKLRDLVDSKGGFVTIGEIGADYSLPSIEEYTTGNKLHTAYGFDFLTDQFSAQHIKRVINTANETVKKGSICWALSNHDVVRVASRWTKEGADSNQVAKLAMTLLVSLKGIPCIYQGEELGFEETDVPFDKLVDPYGIEFYPEFKGRDGCRTPMVWENKPYGKFSINEPWLPISKQHLANSVQDQQTDNGSVYHYTKSLIELRSASETLKRGKIAVLNCKNEDLIAISRKKSSEYITFLNCSNKPAEIDSKHIKSAKLLLGTGIESNILQPFGAAIYKK